MNDPRLPGPWRGGAARGQEVAPAVLILVAGLMEQVPTGPVGAERGPGLGSPGLRMLVWGGAPLYFRTTQK